jgi:RNA polymerase sigma factor (sigma-70 family)
MSVPNSRSLTGSPPVTIGTDGGDDAQRFTALYRAHHRRVRDFAQRRVGTDLAQEVVAETFLVAWRRLDDIPGVAIPWLYRVALYEIANLRRRQAKAVRLHDALRKGGAGAAREDEADDVTELSRAVAIAFANLKAPDQEILRLAAWEQLSSSEGAAVLRCSVPAYRMRLHRARLRLAVASGAREHLGPQPHDPPVPAPSRARALTREHPSLHGPELVL